MNKLILGSHVSMSKDNRYLLGAVQTAINDQATSLMIYTGPPQNTKRTNTELMFVKEAQALAQEHGLSFSNFIIHAPYIINLATFKTENRQFGIQFLIDEIRRAEALNIHKIVLHPGSFVGQTLETGIDLLASALNEVLAVTENSKVIICLETMAGKGNEIGRNFEELATIIAKCNHNPRLGICLDTCHVHDAGYDLSQKQAIIDQFKQIIGLERLQVLHINDSCNFLGARKDRHANIGYGHIGFDILLDWIYEPKFSHLPKILETPYFDLAVEVKDKLVTKSFAPYKYEIELIKDKKWEKKFPPNSNLVFHRTSAGTTPTKRKSL